MKYEFKEIETKWQKYWNDHKIYKTAVDTSKPKYYILDMFPYPSGSGLHVGHPSGYTASDIFSRYKRLKGFNVLHPMGYDAFGLPAEQYAIQTGKHPTETTNENINYYREQLDRIGFDYDWDREFRTSDPSYYKWTQWIFIQLFTHWYDTDKDCARPITELTDHFATQGAQNINASTDYADTFTAKEWSGMTESQQESILSHFRLAYLADTMVNWCPELGTVLANDEVKDGLSERGGHPVEQKVMSQWCLRITAYAERLLNGLESLDWSESIKEIQRNWIGRSEGAQVFFELENPEHGQLEIFTTRPDTIYGTTFMVIAPEHPLVEGLTTSEQRSQVEAYQLQAKRKTERDRISQGKEATGVFTGGYAINPLNGEKIPVWISDYVLISYGTGAIMAVPAHDDRDYQFAKKFNLPMRQVIEGEGLDEGAIAAKSGKIINSDLINGLDVSDAISKIITEIESRGFGKKCINYRLRDAIFGRQRYWGEPFPIYYKNGVPKTLDIDKLPLELPPMESFKPTNDGKPPLGKVANWKTDDGHPLELSTMPGFAGSSAYYLRFMDPRNDEALVSKDINNYWENVDLYIGGIAHATGHLLYSRFWNKFLYDLNYICKDEPFKKLVNQGMVQGRSNFVYRIKGENKYVSHNLKDNYETTTLHVDVNIVQNDILDLEKFKQWRPENINAEFLLEEDGKYHCGWAFEKMSKSLHNVVNPDDIINDYGADTFRIFQMFLGPLEQSKYWDTNGIEGVQRFIGRFWRLYYNQNGDSVVTAESASKDELKILHKTIKKVSHDIEGLSLNTCISAFMICVNELMEKSCHKREILEPLIVLIAPFAPFLAEELWESFGNKQTVFDATYPTHNEKYLVESTFNYPVSFNGKMRFLKEISLDATKDEIEKTILEDEQSQKWLAGKKPKKVIIVPKKIVNIVLG